jgi:hypothetical protein
MKPFSTPVLSKRTYRELKLLKHLKHENVSGRRSRAGTQSVTASDLHTGHQFERHLHITTGRHVSRQSQYFNIDLMLICDLKATL